MTLLFISFLVLLLISLIALRLRKLKHSKNTLRLDGPRATPGHTLPGFENVRFVYFMGENQSFDRWHGALKALFPEMNGIEPNFPLFNDDLNGNRYYQKPATERLPMFGPEHSMADTGQQMSRYAMGDMLGFIANFQRNYPEASAQDLQDIISYFPLGALPFNHGIAKYCKVFDNWHADVPGPTWPNREFPFEGESGEMVNMAPGLERRDAWVKKNLPIIFDLLNQAGVTWKYFYGDVPLALVMKGMRRTENAAHLYPMKEFWKMIAGPAAEIPQVIIIEPTWYPPHDGHGDKPNSDLWPADPFDGQDIQRRIYEALRKSEVWENIVWVSTKDEHGGYFDSMYPPAATPTGAPGAFGEFGFSQFGLRVPTLAISPLIDGGLDQTIYSSVTFTKTLSDVYGLPYLTPRVAAANSLVPIINRLGNPRTDFPMTVEVNESDMPPVGPEAQQKASNSFMGDFGRELTDALESTGRLDAPIWFADIARAIQATRGFVLRLKHRGSSRDELDLARYHAIAKQVPQIAEKARKIVG